MSPRHSPKQQRTTILVVDDEPGIVDVLIAVLQDAGHRASGAANGREALAKLKVSSPDLLLLDVEMPVLDGGATLSAIRADARLSAIPVLVMSGITESIVKRRCRGYDAFLRKPFSLDDLLDAVDALLARKGPSKPRAAEPRHALAPKK